MLKLIPKPYLIVASLALLVGSFGFGWHKGTVNQIAKFEADRIALQEDLFDLGEEISVKNAEILALQQERLDLVHDLETQALEADGSDAPGITATGGLRRLEERWGSN